MRFCRCLQNGGPTLLPNSCLISGENELFRGAQLRLRGILCLHVNRDNDLLHRLAYLDQLRGSRFGMRLQSLHFSGGSSDCYNSLGERDQDCAYN
jgi:hypothetical protein